MAIKKLYIRKVMDRLNGLGSFIVAIVGALGGIKIVEFIFNRKEMRRRAIAEAVSIETDSLIKRYAAMESEFEKLKDKVDELYKLIHQQEKEKIDLLKKNMELEMALKESRYNECRRPDDECLRRLPPRELCLAKKLIGGYYDKNNGILEKPDQG